MSGAATNAGIDFQSRVGASILTTMLATSAELQLLLDLGAQQSVALSLSFESDEEIDDFCIRTEHCGIFIQAKRSIDLSREESSELSKTLGQCVSQYLKDPSLRDDSYVLVTSSRASAKIRHELRKITSDIRSNADWQNNPLTQSERQTLEIVRSHLARHLQAAGVNEPLDSATNEVLKRFHVSVMDIEAGDHLERAILIALNERSAVDARLLWSHLVSLCTRLATSRSSIDVAGLSSQVGVFLRDDRAIGVAASHAEMIKTSFVGGLQADKEVLCFKTPDRIVMSESWRFSDDGEFRHRFTNNEVVFPDGTATPLLLRSATSEGMTRLITANLQLFKNEEVDLVESGMSTPLGQARALQHAELCEKLLNDNDAILECLGCGRPISEIRPQLVEIEQVDQPLQVGLVHSDCRQPAHRLLGEARGDLFDNPVKLVDFDYTTWFANVVGGQGVFNNIPQSVRNQFVPIWWRSVLHTPQVGDWCVAYQDADDELHYVSRRGKVERHSHEQAVAYAESFKQRLADANAAGDPVCISSTSGAFSTRSQIIKHEPDSRAVPVVSVQAQKLSRATMEAYKSCDNYYGPLVRMFDRASGTPLQINGCFVLLTDPSRIPEFVDNWKLMGVSVSELATSVLADDHQVDAFVASAFLEGYGVLVDPVLASPDQMARGLLLTPSLPQDENTDEDSDS